jgi:hypothetical protein
VPPIAPVVQPSAGPQAGGLPATNARVAALEEAVLVLRRDLAAEAAARQAADTRLANALNDEIAARAAADTALANQLATIPSVFVGEGSVSNLRNSTSTVASVAVPSGSYFIVATLQLVNGQSTGDANARCVMRANGYLLADTSDLQFPILTTAGGATSNAFGSTMFAPLQASYSARNPFTVVVECTESNGDNGGLDAFVQIAALKAGTIQ